MSKALESLERIVMPDDLFTKECERLNIDNHSDYETIKKELTAFEIIKKKKVDVRALIEFFDFNNGVLMYNQYISRFNNLYLTQEEFALLKEVLADD